MRLLFSMSAAGTVPLVIYYLVKVMRKDAYSPRWSMRLLKLSMFLFLCPFQRLKYHIPGKKPGFLFESFEDSTRYYLFRPGYIAIPNTWGNYTLQPIWMIVLGLIWAALVIGFVVYQSVKYIRLKKELLKKSERIQKKTEKGRKICYAKNSAMKTPFTIGVLKHWIILPEQEFTEEEEQMILTHELTHIKNRDILKKIICLGIILLHWFNPASWLLLYEYGIISEQLCDERVALSLDSAEKRKTYAMLLVRLSVRETKIPTAFADHLSKGEKNMKKRIDTIMKAGKRKAGVLPLMLVLSVFLSSLTAVAYHKEWSTTKEEFERAGEDRFVYFKDEELEKVYALSFPASGSIFIDDQTGEMWDIPLQDGADVQATCDHTYVEGVKYDHIKNSSGGCTVNQYKAKKCSQCGEIIIVKLIGTMTYPECPH